MTEEKLMEMAELIVEDCLGIREGDKILVLTDDGVDSESELGMIRDAMIDVMNEKDMDPCVMSYKARTKKGAEIPELAEAACLESDVLVSVNTHSFLHSSAFPRIYKGGTTDRRLMLFPSGVSMDGENDYLERMMPDNEEEIREIAAITKKYGAVLRDGKEHTVHLTAGNGTDLTLRLGTLTGSVHTGICEPGTIEIIPAGTLALGVDEGSAEGTLVIDYSTALKRHTLEDKICFEIHDGYADKIHGGKEADDFIAAAAAVPNPDKEKFNIAEFGLGFNPRAKADGQTADGENIVGAAHIGIGSNAVFGGNIFIPAWHIDCIIPYATVEADGKLILKDGEYLL